MVAMAMLFIIIIIIITVVVVIIIIIITVIMRFQITLRTITMIAGMGGDDCSNYNFHQPGNELKGPKRNLEAR